MPPMFTKEEWFTEVDETDGTNLPETPILTVTVHDEDETNKFQYKVVIAIFTVFSLPNLLRLVYYLPVNKCVHISLLTQGL